MRTLLMLAWALPTLAEVTQPQGYHIVQTAPGESHATPAASSVSSTGGKRVQRRSRAKKASSASGGSGFRAPTMATQIAGSIRKH